MNLAKYPIGNSGPVLNMRARKPPHRLPPLPENVRRKAQMMAQNTLHSPAPAAEHVDDSRAAFGMKAEQQKSLPAEMKFSLQRGLDTATLSKGRASKVPPHVQGAEAYGARYLHLGCLRRESVLSGAE